MCRCSGFGVFEAMEMVDGRVADVLAADVRGRAYAGLLHHEWNEDAYKAHFDRVQRYIADGDIYQANLSFRSRFAFAGDPLALYLQLRERSAAAYGAYIDDGGRQILSLSPELFFNLSADGELTARPMKGTIARGGDPRSDARAKDALAASEKDRAENLMIVDLLRNDIGRIAEIGSVRVPSLFAVETYPTLHTMVSTVTAKLKPGADAATILRAVFPCGFRYGRAEDSRDGNHPRIGRKSPRRLLRRHRSFRAERVCAIQCRDPHADD
ncbi:MAG: chorismate-binding protein [Rhizomicrobium sp.]